MDDWSETDLTTLAPVVDEDAALQLFRRRRTRRRARRRIISSVFVLAVLAVAAIAVVAALDGDDGVDVVAQQPTTSAAPAAKADPAFEVIARQEAHDEMGTLRAAIDKQAFTRLWADAKLAGEVPRVDFDRWVVVTVTIPDDACPPELVRFERQGAVLTPLFEEPEGACVQPLIPKTYVAEIARGAVTPSFTLRLPADPIYGFDEQRLRVDIASVSTATAPTSTTAASQPADVERARAEIIDVVFTSATTASVHFTLLTNSGTFPGDGGAVLTDGGWKMTRDTRCREFIPAGLSCERGSPAAVADGSAAGSPSSEVVASRRPS
jgi:hypothetical protein